MTTSNNIIKFTPKEKPTKKKDLILIDNIDIAFVLFAVNLFGMDEGYGLVGPNDLPTFPLNFVLECLQEANTSNLLSEDGRAIMGRLLANNG